MCSTVRLSMVLGCCIPCRITFDGILIKSYCNLVPFHVISFQLIYQCACMCVVPVCPVLFSEIILSFFLYTQSYYQYEAPLKIINENEYKRNKQNGEKDFIISHFAGSSLFEILFPCMNSRCKCFSKWLVLHCAPVSPFNSYHSLTVCLHKPEHVVSFFLLIPPMFVHTNR